MKLSLIKIALLGASGLLLAGVAPAMAQGDLRAPHIVSIESMPVDNPLWLTIKWNAPCDGGDGIEYVVYVAPPEGEITIEENYTATIVQLAKGKPYFVTVGANHGDEGVYFDEVEGVQLGGANYMDDSDPCRPPTTTTTTTTTPTTMTTPPLTSLQMERPTPRNLDASRAAWRGSGRGMLSSALDVLTDYVLEMEYPLPVRVRVGREIVADEVLPFGDSGEREASFGEILDASEFRLSLTPRTPQAQSVRAGFSVWGAGDVRGYQVDGKTASGHNYAGYVGADVRAQRWQGGVAASYTTAQSGDVTNWFASAYPYLRIAPHEQIEFWLLAGAGFGRQADSAENINADLLYHFYASGLRVRSRSLGGLRFGLKTDAAVALYQSLNERAEFAFREQRWRLSGQMNYDWRLGAASVRPSLEISARVDSTDDDTRTIAGESAAGVRIVYEGFSLDARGRSLFANDAGAPRVLEWGASVSARLHAGSNGEGLALALTPSWDLARSQLNAEMSYGIRNRAMLFAPFVQYRLSEGGQAAGLGSRFAWQDATLELLAERRDGVGAAAYRLTARLSLRPRFVRGAGAGT